MHSFMAGTNLYVVAPKGLFVVGLNNSALTAPVLAGEMSGGELKNPRAVGGGNEDMARFIADFDRRLVLE